MNVLLVISLIMLGVALAGEFSTVFTLVGVVVKEGLEGSLDIQSRYSIRSSLALSGSRTHFIPFVCRNHRKQRLNRGEGIHELQHLIPQLTGSGRSVMLLLAVR